jgi:hypothetical protein
MQARELFNWLPSGMQKSSLKAHTQTLDEVSGYGEALGTLSLSLSKAEHEVEGELLS